jgi:Tfp pilus assembly protein PilF
MRRSLALLLLAVPLAVGCAPLAKEHQGDAAFRKAIAAQLAWDEARAEKLYREVLGLGLDWSPVWNNLAVIAVHRHQYSHARKLLAQAVAANDRDVVALTNYGVISYHLSDYREAKRTLADARALRKRLIDSLTTVGRTPPEEQHYARATESLERVAKKYLARIERAEGAQAPDAGDAPEERLDLHADIGNYRF